jgi:hypothetical protein
MKFGRQVMPLKMTSKSYFFNLVASAIQKWQTFKIMRWVQLLNRLVDSDEMLYGGDDTEHCLLYAYVEKVRILVLSRAYCYFVLLFPHF